MAHYIKNDINYHGARSKTRVHEQGNSKKPNSYADNKTTVFPSQNGGDGWGSFETAGAISSDDVWGDVPDNSNVSEDGWEQERLVKGKARKNRKFRPITGNDLIRISNQEPDWNNVEAEFPALGQRKPPVANVWEKRREKFQEIQSLQPTNETEEEYMIRKAMELSKAEAMKDEEKRRQLEEEYKLQMHLMETNPLLFEEFRTDEELAVALSKECVKDIPGEREWDCDTDGSTLEAGNSKSLQKEVCAENKFVNSKACFKNSASSKQKELQTGKKQQMVLPSAEQNANVTKSKPASHTRAISKASKAVDMFGGWGTSQKHSPPLKEMDTSNNTAVKSSTSKLDATKNQTEISKSKAASLEKAKASNTVVGVKSNDKKDRVQLENKSLNQSLKSPAGDSSLFNQKDEKNAVHLRGNENVYDINDADENTAWKSQSRIFHAKPENHIKTEITKSLHCGTESSKNNISVTTGGFKASDAVKANQNSFKDDENMNKISLENKTFEHSSRSKTTTNTKTIDQKSLDNVETQSRHTETKCQMKENDKDFAWRSENTVFHEVPMSCIETNIKETLHSNENVENIETKTSSDLLSSIVSDYSELAAKCDDILQKSKNQKLAVNNNEKTKSTEVSIFNILEKDYSSKDILNTSLEDECSLDSKKDLSSMPEILPPFSNCDSQIGVPKPNAPSNEISYSLKNLSPDSSKGNPFNENYTNSLFSNETLAVESPALFTSSLDKKCENDISLPLFTALSDNSNNDNLTSNNETPTSIDAPKPPQVSNSFPEHLTAHFSSFPGPMPTNTFMNSNFMMNPLIMQQMLMTYPFLLMQLTEMEGYYKSMGMPIGMGLPFRPQPVPPLAGTGVPVGQAFMTPMYNLPGSGHSGILNRTSEPNSANPFIDPPVPPPHQTTDFEGKNVSFEPPGINPSFVLPDAADVAMYSAADDSFLDSLLSREPQFEDPDFIPPPTMPQNSVPNNIGLITHVENTNKNGFNYSSNNVGNSDNTYIANQPNKGMESICDNFALPNTYTSIPSNSTINSVHASSERDKADSLHCNNTTRSAATEMPSSWNAGVNDWGNECQITTSMRNSSRYVFEKDGGNRQPARQPYLGGKKK